MACPNVALVLRWQVYGTFVVWIVCIFSKHCLTQWISNIHGSFQIIIDTLTTQIMNVTHSKSHAADD